MCQLLGLNSNLPTDICASFAGFRARGGRTDEHADGWGIAFFEDRGLRILNEPHPSCQSQLAEMVAEHPFQATNIVAHIRKATVGTVRLENTHPFSRRLWGRDWVFAHNGTLVDFVPRLEGDFRPRGCTDSERAFCWLMDGLQHRFGDVRPDFDTLFAWLREAAVALSDYGVINFLLSDGELMLAHCSTRLSHVLRQAPFKRRVRLVDTDEDCDLGQGVDPATRSVVLTTVPLTHDEAWVNMPAGSLWGFRDGRVLATAPTVEGRVRQQAEACA